MCGCNLTVLGLSVYTDVSHPARWMFIIECRLRILSQLNKQILLLFLLANVNSCSCSLYVVVRPSVVCLSSVTLVHPTQAIEIFGNVSTPFGTLAICDPSVKILRRSSQENPSVGGLNQRVLKKCSDFGPLPGYISETVQDRW